MSFLLSVLSFFSICTLLSSLFYPLLTVFLFCYALSSSLFFQYFNNVVFRFVLFSRRLIWSTWYVSLILSVYFVIFWFDVLCLLVFSFSCSLLSFVVLNSLIYLCRLFVLLCLFSSVCVVLYCLALLCCFFSVYVFPFYVSLFFFVTLVFDSLFYLFIRSVVFFWILQVFCIVFLCVVASCFCLRLYLFIALIQFLAWFYVLS